MKRWAVNLFNAWKYDRNIKDKNSDIPIMYKYLVRMSYEELSNELSYVIP